MDGDGSRAFMGADRCQGRFVLPGGGVAQGLRGALLFGDVRAVGVDHIDVACRVDSDVERALKGARGAGAGGAVEGRGEGPARLEAHDAVIAAIGNEQIVRGRVDR